MKKNFLNCIVCDRKIQLISQCPEHGTLFSTRGNFGSTLIDMNEERAQIIFCDKCLCERKDRIYQLRKDEYSFIDYEEMESFYYVEKIIKILYPQVKEIDNDFYVLVNNDFKIEEILEYSFKTDSDEKWQSMWKNAESKIGEKRFKELKSFNVGSIKSYVEEIDLTIV